MREGGHRVDLAEVPDLGPVVDAVCAAAKGRDRTFVAIAGAPGSGKSTLAEQLCQMIDKSAVLPMDGFHLDNAVLEARGLLARKGAPETFDTQGLHAVLSRAASGGACRVPTFDRDQDRVIPDGGRIEEDTQIVLVEGNYLLLDRAAWHKIQPFWSYRIFLDVPIRTLEQRLIRRWLDQGLPHDKAVARARENDLVNAQIVATETITPDMTVVQKSAAKNG